jgi:hypothetical protein
MKEVPLLDLPRWSQWPTRLLGLTSWEQPTRTLAKVDREYDKGQYARLLAHYEQVSGKPTPDEMEEFNYNLPPENPMCISVGDTLFEVPLAQARQRYYDLLCDSLRPFAQAGRTVIELGSGYGYNLWMLKKRLAFTRFWGGEYSANAVRLGNLLYANEPSIKIFPFNYYEPASYPILSDAAQPVVIFTSHSLEQIPCAQPVIEALSLYRDVIDKVVHFEPAHDLFDDSLLGQMRRRYTQLNNYNADLVAQLKNRPDIRIDDIQPHVLGFHALNPASVITWSFQ